nr:hypothetical protein [Actinomyces ruminis]
MNAELVMIVVPECWVAICSASSVQHEPASTITVSPSWMSPAAARAMRALSA